MKSPMVALLAAITVLLAVPSASAQGKIDLGRITSGRILISKEGGGSLSLRLCAKVVHRKCVGDLVEGPARASGEFGHVSGFFTVQGNAITTGTFTGCVGTTCNWTLSTPSPYAFEFTRLRHHGGINYLDGELGMIELKEAPEGKHFLVTIALDLEVTGGTLAQYFGGGNVIMFYRFKTDKFLGGISELYQQFGASPLPAPGP
jgi:hypothetical protein